MNNFKDFFLPDSLYKSLANLKLNKPTEVQIKAIPQILDSKDIIVSAPTGTGKTLAFSIPLIAKLLTDKNFNALIVTPTRELATQIMDVLQSLLNGNKEIKSLLLIGGKPIVKQLTKLKAKPQLIVGTPGRINDHLKRKSLYLTQTKFVILDEMDRMLDMGFSIQIDEIFKFLPASKQILMFSATIPPTIAKLANKYLNNPVKISINPSEIVNTDIKQDFIHIAVEQKYPFLIEQLSKSEGAVIIFVKTKRNTEDLVKKLKHGSFTAQAIHGGLRQHQREKIINRFRKEENNIVVATDVAARGIDVPHIKYVINYNLPTNPEDYVHRVGRTGRAGQEGNAICFIAPNEKREWYALERFLDPSKAKKMPARKRRGTEKKKPNNRFNRFAKKKNKKAHPNTSPANRKKRH